MNVRTMVLVAAAASLACGGASTISDAGSTSAQRSCAGGRDTTKVPINDLGTRCYLSFAGGLYPDGSNTVPAAHAAAGLAAAAQIRPLDASGSPRASGK